MVHTLSHSGCCSHTPCAPNHTPPTSIPAAFCCLEKLDFSHISSGLHLCLVVTKACKFHPCHKLAFCYFSKCYLFLHSQSQLSSSNLFVLLCSLLQLCCSPTVKPATGISQLAGSLSLLVAETHNCLTSGAASWIPCVYWMFLQYLLI